METIYFTRFSGFNEVIYIRYIVNMLSFSNTSSISTQNTQQSAGKFFRNHRAQQLLTPSRSAPLKKDLLLSDKRKLNGANTWVRDLMGLEAGVRRQWNWVRAALPTPPLGDLYSEGSPWMWISPINCPALSAWPWAGLWTLSHHQSSSHKRKETTSKSLLRSNEKKMGTVLKDWLANKLVELLRTRHSLCLLLRCVRSSSSNGNTPIISIQSSTLFSIFSNTLYL